MSKKDNIVDLRKKQDEELAKMQNQSSQPTGWKKYFLYKKKSNGDFDGLKTTSKKNILLILNNDKHLKDLFKYNSFTQNVDVSRNETIDLTQYGSGKIKFKCGALKDIDVNNLGIYFESFPDYHVTFKTQLINEAVDVSAVQHSYNPLVDYMENCLANWDHKRRLDDFFHIFLGAEKNETNILVTRLWFMGAVAKVYNPSIKFDYVLDLVGGQGAGKTSLLRKIAPLGLYTDQFTTFTKVDDFEVMKNALIVNDDEMTASNKASFEEIKKFITMQTFEYRKAYGRHTERFSKKFVIARTTNEISHLKDRSGDRRFMSILVDKSKQQLHPVDSLTSDYVKQLWGEVVWLYKQAKDPFKLTKGQEKLLVGNRDQFLYRSGLEDKLLDVLENDFKNNNFISNSELSFKIFADEDALSRNTKDARDVRYYMEHYGYKSGQREKIDGKAIRGFKKSDSK